MPVIVNGEQIEDKVVDREIEVLRPHYERLIQGDDPAALENQLHEWARENVIERTLLKQEANRIDQAVDPEAVDAKMEELKKHFEGEEQLFDALDLTERTMDRAKQEIAAQMRLEAMIEELTKKVARPKLKEVSEQYRRNIDQYRTDELVRAAHIVKHIDESIDEKTARAQIDEVAARIKAGEEFAAVADEDSDCPGSGGDLGYFPRGQMVQEFEDVVFSLNVGEISEVFRTPFGFHLARVLDRQPAGHQPFPVVRDQIEEELMQEKKTHAIEDFTDRLKAKAEIQILVNPVTGSDGPLTRET